MTEIDSKHEPPASDEVLAYLCGDLSAEQEASFRSRMIDYPDLLRTLVAPFPEPAQSLDDDYLDGAEFARCWRDFQRRVDHRAKVVSFWPTVAAVAAVVAIVFISMYWNVRTDQRQPRVISTGNQPLYPDLGGRGPRGNPIAVAPAGDAYSLILLTMDDRVFDNYRVELFDARAQPSHSLWSGDAIGRSGDSALIVMIPRSFARPGVYRLSVSGLGGGRREHVNDYTVRLAP